MNRPRILIAAAVPGELEGLAARLSDASASPCGGRERLSGRILGVPVHLLTTGPGLANAVQSITAAVEDHPPDLILQTGCAGAFAASGLGVGDLGVADEEIDVHLGVEPEGEGRPPDPPPFPILEGRGWTVTHRYPLNGRLSEAAFQALTGAFGEKGVVVRKGPFVTVATITATDRRAALLHSRYAPVMEAMEGAGAAHVALHYGIPFLEIRAASNRAGLRDRASWNLPLAFRRAADAVYEILRRPSLFTPIPDML